MRGGLRGPRRMWRARGLLALLPLPSGRCPKRFAGGAGRPVGGRETRRPRGSEARAASGTTAAAPLALRGSAAAARPTRPETSAQPRGEAPRPALCGSRLLRRRARVATRAVPAVSVGPSVPRVHREVCPRVPRRRKNRGAKFYIPGISDQVGLALTAKAPV